MFSLIQLEYIVAVDTYRHFVTAAEKCFVTQPTLSMQIKKMEEELGVVIFDRTKQPIIPTEIGEKIIDQAKTIIAESKQIGELVSAFNHSVSGELSIGIIPSLAPYLLPLFVGDFAKKYPEVKVTVTELITDEIISQLKRDTIDVGILVTPLHEKGVLEDPLFYEEMYMYINKNHIFAKQKIIETAELASPDLWLLSKGHCFRSQVINLCNTQSDNMSKTLFAYESGSLETLRKFVEVEGGFTLLPELAIQKKDVGKTSMAAKAVVRQFNNITPLREVSFAYTRNHAKRRLLSVLKEQILQSVPRDMHQKNRGVLVEWREVKG